MAISTFLLRSSQFSSSSQLRPSFFELEPLELTDQAVDFEFYQLFHDYSCGFLRS